LLICKCHEGPWWIRGRNVLIGERYGGKCSWGRGRGRGGRKKGAHLNSLFLRFIVELHSPIIAGGTSDRDGSKVVFSRVFA
jgi:hypothetical protein